MERLSIVIRFLVLLLSLITVFGASFAGTLALLSPRDLLTRTLIGGCATVLIGATSLFFYVWRMLHNHRIVGE